MSHVASVECYVTDLDAFQAAVVACGGQLVRGQETFGWFGRWVGDFTGDRAAVTQGYDPATFGRCTHAVHLPGATYELGLVPRRDGKGFEVLYDNWGAEGTKLHKAFGVDLGRLKQGYAERVATKQLARQGYRTRVETLAGGARRITATRIAR